jgi:hypothetical protein
MREAQAAAVVAVMVAQAIAVDTLEPQIRARAAAARLV